ncbi:MAG: site-specific DNA-methyltransferase [Gemmatimonadetes bacterium]|nr:site-specific DNA-methyltransferase [Gemmatimonadota bacterium]
MARNKPLNAKEFAAEIQAFADFGKETQILDFPDPAISIPVYVNEFWTAKQRAAHSLHEVSYRACFKPQLPRFFISRLTQPGDAVYDPFMGRGTTVLEAALLGRRPIGCDINPLSERLVRPRLYPPTWNEVETRLTALNLDKSSEVWDALLVFYHPNTLRQIVNLRSYLLTRRQEGPLDPVDAWIQMVATNRLTGHSPGFFSVYTLPPNQAVSIESQKRINQKRAQVPPERDIKAIILRKTRSLLSKLQARELKTLTANSPLLITGSSDNTSAIASASIQLAVTSPPFLDIVNYQADNWLRCWFNGIDAKAVAIWQLKKPADWQAAMTRTFRELHRILANGGFVAFEVGEVRNGKILLETLVVPAAMEAGLKPLMVLVNDQMFTKTANCWGVDNRTKGTNTNRIVLIGK